MPEPLAGENGKFHIRAEGCGENFSGSEDCSVGTDREVAELLGPVLGRVSPAAQGRFRLSSFAS